MKYRASIIDKANRVLIVIRKQLLNEQRPTSLHQLLSSTNINVKKYYYTESSKIYHKTANSTNDILAYIKRVLYRIVAYAL